jgi:hypothetical protein
VQELQLRNGCSRAACTSLRAHKADMCQLMSLYIYAAATVIHTHTQSTYQCHEANTTQQRISFSPLPPPPLGPPPPPPAGYTTRQSSKHRYSRRQRKTK